MAAGATWVYQAAAAVRIPTLLVHGALSDIVGAQGIRKPQELIPGAAAVEVPGAGHMVASDDNSIFLERIGGFLTAL